MRAASLAYLRHFMAQVDALQWLEQAHAEAEAAVGGQGRWQARSDGGRQDTNQGQVRAQERQGQSGQSNIRPLRAAP